MRRSVLLAYTSLDRSELAGMTPDAFMSRMDTDLQIFDELLERAEELLRMSVFMNQRVVISQMREAIRTIEREVGE